MTADLHPAALSWDEVDPARHPFDSASAIQAVQSLEPARHVPSAPDLERIADPDLRIRARNAWDWQVAQPWADAMSHALAERYGRWALGWRWGHGESDLDGGPLKNWCCTSHSITTPEGTLASVAAALCEWREWLESLADWFEDYPLDPSIVVDQRVMWQRAARDLIGHVVDRTECWSGWYGHCDRVLTWFLERWDVAPDLAQDLVEEAIGGRFESWTTPDMELVDDVAQRLAQALPPVGGAASGGAAPDHLQRWLAVREQVPWKEGKHDRIQGPLTASRDGAVEYVHAFDAVIDPARARGLLTALELMRADAARGAPLDFELLRGWQQHVLGASRPPPFRTHPAFAKAGRERYGIGEDTLDRLDACLAESASGGDHPLLLSARAARACLDVCFFHPFDDGNARSAFLTLLFVLAREGIVPEDVRLLRRVSFHADDPQDALWLASAIERNITNP